MNFLKEIWDAFKGSVKGFDSPKQLAVGVVFGILVGILPKDSALPYVIGLVAILSRGNLLCFALAGIAFDRLAIHLDPATNWIGGWVLHAQFMQSTWNYLGQLPVVAWTRFNNTVVMGSLILGLAISLPAYFSAVWFFEKFGNSIFKIISNNPIARWLVEPPSPSLNKS